MAAGIPELFFLAKREIERHKPQDERLEQKAFMLKEPTSDKRTAATIYVGNLEFNRS